MKDEKTFDIAVSYLSYEIFSKLFGIDSLIKNKVFEVRVRLGQPLQLIGEFGSLFVCSNSSLTLNADKCDYKVLKEDIIDSFSKICNYSVHTHLEEIQKGFITIEGGHRVGICGTAVIKENKLYNIRDISSLNLRIANQVIDCSKMISDEVIFSNDSLIIVGAPSSGKTTVLRDIARRLSNNAFKVTVVDERFEMAATFNGITSNDLGMCTDVLSGFPKAIGITTAIRSLSPNVIICDEISSTDETKAILEGFNSGVRFIVSMHAADFESLKNKPQYKILYNSGEFNYAVILSCENNVRQAEIFNLKEKI